MTLSKIVLIANPNAGRKGSGALEDAVSLLKRHFETTVVYTRKPGHATEISSEFGGCDETLLAVCGGDGTIFETINGLPPAGLLGLLPGGTANVITRELGISTDIREAAKILITGAARAFDTGFLRHPGFSNPGEASGSPNPDAKSASKGMRFFMVAGFGLDAHVASRVHWLPKKILGQYAYHLETVMQYPFYDPPNISVIVDGKNSYQGQFALIANLRRYGGNLFFAPSARPDDGLLDLVLFRNVGPHSILKGGYGAISGRGVPLDIAHRIQGKRFDLSFDKPIPFQLDGEVFPAISNAAIDIMPNSLKMVVP